MQPGVCSNSEVKDESISRCCLGFQFINGACQHCPDGQYGQGCTEPCPKGRFGAQCAGECECLPEDCDTYLGCPKHTPSISEVVHDSITGVTYSGTSSFSAPRWPPTLHSSTRPSISTSSSLVTSTGTLTSGTIQYLSKHWSTSQFGLPNQETNSKSNILIVVGMGAGMVLMVIVILVLLAQRFMRKTLKHYNKTNDVEITNENGQGVPGVYQDINYDLMEESRNGRQLEKDNKRYEPVDKEITASEREGLQIRDGNDLSQCRSTYLNVQTTNASSPHYSVGYLEPIQMTKQRNNSYVEMIESSVQINSNASATVYENSVPMKV